MNGQRLALIARHLGRLRSNRSILTGFGLGFLVLGIIALGAYGLSVERPELIASPTAELQRRLWEPGGLFGTLLFIVAAVLGSSMVNDDIKRGTIIGVLARPVSRNEYFVCSWLGAATVLIALDFLRVVVTAGSAAILEGRFPALRGVGMVATLAGDLLFFTMFSAIGAAWSTGAAVLAGIVLFVVETLAFSPKIPLGLTYPLRALGMILPTPVYQDAIVSRAILGEIRDPMPVLEIVAYRLCWTIVLIALGALAFRNRDVVSRTSG